MSTSVTRSMRPEFKPFTALFELYEILGVPHDASTDDIKRAYRRLAVKLHPDKHEERDKRDATEVFKKISLAYKTLVDPVRRREYDRRLAQGTASRVAEDARYEQVDPLAEILEQLHKHADLFSYDHIQVLDQSTREFLENNLEHGLKERVIGAVQLSELPEGIDKPQGDFVSGSMVFTTLRIFFPFTMQWKETQGNTEITHTNLHLQSVTLPSIRRVVVDVRGRLSRKTTLSLEMRDDKAFAITPKSVNLARLFTLLTYWGIPITKQEVASKMNDIRDAVWGVPSLIGGGVVAVLAIALVCGCCASRGDEPFTFVGPLIGLLVFGVGQLLVLIAAIAASQGKARAIAEYERRHVRDLVEEEG